MAMALQRSLKWSWRGKICSFSIGSRSLATAQRVDSNAVSICFDDGVKRRFHWLWLRDNCLGPSSRTANGQRLFETADLVEGVGFEGAAEPVGFNIQTAPSNSQNEEDASLEVAWADGHRSTFPLNWLRKHSYDTSGEAQDPPQAHGMTQTWNSRIKDSVPQVTYSEIVSGDDGKLEFSKLMNRFGFCLVRQVPVEMNMVINFGNLVGFVRHTNYGTTFDVLDKGAAAENLAYTNVSITQHTDNPYRDPVPGVQLLHCLQAAPGQGGETVLVDGFAAAEKLRSSNPSAFHLLSTHAREFRYCDETHNTDLRNTIQVIQLDTQGHVQRIHFNNRSAAVLQVPYDLVLPYYEAWAAFQQLLQDEDAKLALRLQPGDLLAFENHRVLHGRNAYQSGAPRHLQGAYIDVDALRSRVASAASKRLLI